MDANDRIGRRLKLKDLHYLLTVVEAGSMAKAAPVLSVSQPVLSKTIAELERALGARLLDRGPRGVEPTLYGRRLIASSHAIFDELRQGVKEIEFLADSTAGELSVGSNEASSLSIVPACIDKLRELHPHAVIHVVIANSADEQKRALRERRIDFSIGRIAELSAGDDEFETELLYYQRFAVVAGRHNSWLGKANVRLEDLLGEPWILPSTTTISGQQSAEVFRLSNLKAPNPVVETSSFQLTSGLLESGPFVALLPVSILPFILKNTALALAPVSLPPQFGPVGVMKLRHRKPSPLALEFLKFARDVAQASSLTSKT